MKSSLKRFAASLLFLCLCGPSWGQSRPWVEIEVNSPSRVRVFRDGDSVRVVVESKRGVPPSPVPPTDVPSPPEVGDPPAVSPESGPSEWRGAVLAALEGVPEEARKGLYESFAWACSGIYNDSKLPDGAAAGAFFLTNVLDRSGEDHAIAVSRVADLFTVAKDAGEVKRMSLNLWKSIDGLRNNQ